MSKELEVAIKAAKEAGEIIKENFNNINPVTFKEDGGSLTKIDKLAEDKIVSIIKENFPDHSINAEESGLSEKESEYLWLVDPIDGTGNFAAQIPYFSISIALSKNEEALLGVIYDPIHEDLYIAEKGKGAKRNGSHIAVSNCNSLEKAMIGYSRSPAGKKEYIQILSKLESRTRTSRSLGSTALELCYLASGNLDGVVIVSVKPWDHGAAALIVEEAKGEISDFDGKPYSLNSNSFLATNGRIHQRLLGILRE